jgi:glycosyltransferase involved in cell wall biosynthesis
MYVGSFAVYQGIDLIFGAIPLVCADTPQARFVIIGGSSEEIATRREALGRAADAVTFAGMIHPDQLPDYLAAADVLLSTRISGNNTPLKLLDYLKAGRSILAVDSEANRLILDEKLALFTAPTVPGVAEGIRRLVREPVLRDQLASAGRALIDEHYNYAGFKQRLADVYRTLTA